MKFQVYFAGLILALGTACGGSDQLSGQEYNIDAASLSCSSSSAAQAQPSNANAQTFSGANTASESSAANRISFSGNRFDITRDAQTTISGSFSRVDNDTLQIKLPDGTTGTVDYTVNQNGQFVIEKISCNTAGHSSTALPATSGDSHRVYLDSDNDGIPDVSDPSPYDYNPDIDSDGDGIPNNRDPSPYVNNSDIDSDGDGAPDDQDPAPYEYGTQEANTQY